MIRISALALAALALQPVSPAVAKPPSSTAAATSCKQADGHAVISSPTGGQISVRTIGTGRPVLMISSLGRDVSDFDDLAEGLARKGWMIILPDPRGIGGSTGPKPASLFDLAQDVASVIETLCDGPIDVVGQPTHHRSYYRWSSATPSRSSRAAGDRPADMLAGAGADAGVRQLTMRGRTCGHFFPGRETGKEGPGDSALLACSDTLTV